MTLFWKGGAVLGLAMAAFTMTAAPAQAQHYRDRGYGWDGPRDGWRGDYRRGDRRYHRDRRDWRGHRRHYRTAYRHRARCWSEWRYDRYRHRDVRVRICR